MNQSSYTSKDHWDYVNYLDTGSITKNFIEGYDYIDLSKTALPSRAKRKVEVGDIVYSTVRPNLCHYGMLESVPDNCLVSTGFAVIKASEDKINPRFLYYFLTLPKVVEGLHSIGEQGQATYPAINPSDIEELEIAYPDRSVQDAIVSILSNYDSAIANCRRQIALLEEAAMRLYKEWFKEERGEKKKIGDICSIIGAGGTPSRRNSAYWNNGTIPWYKTGELKDTWLYDAEEKITEAGLVGSAAKMFPAETVLMAIYASPTLGRLGILDKPGCCNQATLCFCPNTSMASWQWLYCKLFDLRDAFNAIARGAGQQNISGVVVKEYPILLPTPEAMASFTEKVSLMFSATRSLGRQIRALTEARDRLLPKLMKGEIAV